MGNTCCQATTDSTLIDKILKTPEFYDYEEAEWPENDNFLNDIKSALVTDESVKKEIRKNSIENRYYIGDWDKQLGKPHGKGIFYDPNLITYEGDFSNGKFQGNAKVNFLKRKCFYEGKIQEGKAEGYGKLVNETEKYSFVGNWKDSKPYTGSLTFDDDPNVKEIDFNGGQSTVIYYKDFRKYRGDINSRFLPDGNGRVDFPEISSKDYFEGEWAAGQKHGKGKYVLKDGSTYEGSYNEGIKEGQGKYKFASGNVYQGEWKNDCQDGLGILTDKFGKEKKKGEWEKGKFVKALNEEEWLKMKNPTFEEKKEEEDEKHEDKQVEKIQQIENEQQEIKKENEENNQQSNVSPHQIREDAVENQNHSAKKDNKDLENAHEKQIKEDQKEEKKEEKKEEEKKEEISPDKKDEKDDQKKDKDEKNQNNVPQKEKENGPSQNIYPNQNISNSGRQIQDKDNKNEGDDKKEENKNHEGTKQDNKINVSESKGKEDQKEKQINKDKTQLH